MDNFCKCFVYVTKTIANLTTCSRKPGNYNGINIFEVDIMKNSSPLDSQHSQLSFRVKKQKKQPKKL